MMTTSITTPITEAWHRLEAAHKLLQEQPTDADDSALWALVDNAELEILHGHATGIGDVALQVRLALLHTLDDRSDEAAILRNDLDYLAQREKALDFNERVILAALNSLLRLEA